VQQLRAEVAAAGDRARQDVKAASAGLEDQNSTLGGAVLAEREKVRDLQAAARQLERQLAHATQQAELMGATVQAERKRVREMQAELATAARQAAEAGRARAEVAEELEAAQGRVAELEAALGKVQQQLGEAAQQTQMQVDTFGKVGSRRSLASRCRRRGVGC
jgi:chromosome segregation ATPase